MEAYHGVVRDVLARGTRKENRTGIDTISAFNINYSIDLSEGFPLLTSKEVSWKNIVVESIWFLSGAQDIKFLRKHKCKFWDPWADEAGFVPSAYGYYWRNFPNAFGKTDQIRFVVDELKRNPNSRRLVVSAWDPANAVYSRLPPCHAFYVLNVQRTPDGEPRLCLHLTQRSCDVALGLPYNIAGYAFLLELFGRFSGIRPGVFAHTLVDAHIYTSKADGTQPEYDHIPGLVEQIGRDPIPLPRLKLTENVRSLDDIPMLLECGTEVLMDNFQLFGYNPHPPIKFKVAV